MLLNDAISMFFTLICCVNFADLGLYLLVIPFPHQLKALFSNAKERQSERGKPSGGQGAPPLEIPKFSAHEIAYNTR